MDFNVGEGIRLVEAMLSGPITRIFSFTIEIGESDYDSTSSTDPNLSFWFGCSCARQGMIWNVPRVQAG